MKIICIMCDKDALCVRYTQFAGAHPFCETCAKKEDDYGVNDPSSHLWGPIEKYSEDI